MAMISVLRLIVILAAFCLFAQPLPAAEKTDAPPKTEQTGNRAAPEAQAEAEAGADETRPLNNAWEMVWSGQREMINEIRETALKLSDNFSRQTSNLTAEMRPFEEEGRRLLVFVNTFKGHPNAMEAVNRRLVATIADLNEVLEPVTLARAEAESLLERVNYMAESLPDDVDKSRFSPEMQGYIDDIARARLRLTAALAQYDSILPSLSLLKRLEDARKEISDTLPALWKNFYLQKPVPWLNPVTWVNVARDLYYSWQAMLLRLPVELPVTGSEWGTSVVRFFIGLLFIGVLILIIRKRLLNPGSPPAALHIFKIGLPWLAAGFACIGGALSASGDFFRLFLAFGSLCVIIGETFLAWDLRLLAVGAKKVVLPPFMALMPLALCAYAILYLPLTQPLSLVVWTLALLYALLRIKKWRKRTLASMQFESGVLDCYSIILWPCLFLAMSGLHIYSMGLYLGFVSLSIGIELSLGGMSIVNKVNDHLPQEGARAVIARLLVALAAPFVLVLAVAGVFLWVAMLPGGVYLLGEYALKGVNIGATQFNIVQVLLIFSAFYLTRTVVSMGTRFLTKLPQQGMHFDSTLITPMQTALTYVAWAVFGLFVLKSLGMELSNLAIVAGGLSVGIGFGMQTIVNNFFSGLILIFGRTLQVGDVVEVGGTTGRVRKISVRATMVETYDNAIIFVPNSEFMASRLINWNSFSRSVRREVQVGVAYGTDTKKVIDLLIDIAKKHENVLKYPMPSVNFADFAASSLDFRLRFWVKDFEMGASTASDIRLAIDRVFSDEHIEIAFPQMDIHVRDVPELDIKERLPAPMGTNAPRSKSRPVVRRRPPVPRPASAGAGRSGSSHINQ